MTDLQVLTRLSACELELAHNGSPKWLIRFLPPLKGKKKKSPFIFIFGMSKIVALKRPARTDWSSRLPNPGIHDGAVKPSRSRALPKSSPQEVKPSRSPAFEKSIPPSSSCLMPHSCIVLIKHYIFHLSYPVLVQILSSPYQIPI